MCHPCTCMHSWFQIKITVATLQYKRFSIGCMALPADDSCTLHVLKLCRCQAEVIASFENDPILCQSNAVPNGTWCAHPLGAFYGGGVRLFYCTDEQVLPIMQHIEQHGVVMLHKNGSQCVVFPQGLRPWHIVTTHHHLSQINAILLTAPSKYRCNIVAQSEPVTVFVKNDA